MDSTHVVIELWYNYVQIIVAYGIELLGEWVLNFEAAKFTRRVSEVSAAIVTYCYSFAYSVICNFIDLHFSPMYFYNVFL